MELPRIRIITLGCKLNQYESSLIEKKFLNFGFRIVKDNTQPDWTIINSCTVTSRADSKTRKAVHNALRNGSKVALVGCFPQAFKNNLRENVKADIILGNSNKLDVVGKIAELQRNVGELPVVDIPETDSEFQDVELFPQTGKTRAYLKIQDGCDYNCSYCIVPLARGNPRSRAPESVIREAKMLSKSGFREIVLTGVNLGTYSFSVKDREFRLHDLLTELLKIEQIERYRLSSIEVNTVDENLLSLIQSDFRIARHLHLPLQSGSDKILKLMNRRYTSQQYGEMVFKIKQTIPEICIGADVIVGFPGESEEEFGQTVEFVRKYPIDYLHVFIFSKRENTKAWTLKETVDYAEKRRRSKILREISSQKKQLFLSSMEGTDQKVIVESTTNGFYYCGHSSNYMKVYISGENKKIQRNQALDVIIGSKYKDGVIGELKFV